MRTKLSPRQVFALYGILFFAVFSAYVLGLFFGKNYFVEMRSSVAGAAPAPAPVSDVKTQLEFYQQLMGDLGVDPVRRQPDRLPEEDLEEPVADATDPFPPPGDFLFQDELQAEPPPADSDGFTVQVGAFSTPGEARQLSLRLQARGHSPEVQHEGLFYRVWVGDHSTLEEARLAEQRLRQEGFPTYLRRRAFSGPLN